MSGYKGHQAADGSVKSGEQESSKPGGALSQEKQSISGSGQLEEAVKHEMSMQNDSHVQSRE